MGTCSGDAICSRQRAHHSSRETNDCAIDSLLLNEGYTISDPGANMRVIDSLLLRILRKQQRRLRKKIMYVRILFARP